MAWAEWNRVLDEILAMPMGNIPIAAPLESDKEDFKIKPEKEFVRLVLASNVPAPVKRFLHSTIPKKMWFDNFFPRRSNYAQIYKTRKYDGWFMCLYVNRHNQIEWQTMGGYIFKFMEVELEEFIQYLQKRVGSTMHQDYCFKMEFTARRISDDREVLRDVGFRDPCEVEYVAVITDFFDGYSDAMDKELNNMLLRTNDKAHTIMQPDVTPTEWRALWTKHSRSLPERLDAANCILEAGRERTLRFQRIKIEVAQATELAQDRDTMVQTLARELTTDPIEGYILHCIERDSNGDVTSYDVYKFKIEYLGGLNHYYTFASMSGTPDQYQVAEGSGPASVRPLPDQKVAGRQFVVRCLTAECFPFSNIPHSIGIGYQKEANKFFVVDVLKLKGVFKKSRRQWLNRVDGDAGAVGKYLSVTNAAAMVADHQQIIKHKELTESNKSIANMIAFMADNMEPRELVDYSNLAFSNTFLDATSGSFINVSKCGIVIGGSANMIYVSEKGNYHIQAGIVKCMGVETKRAVKAGIDPSDMLTKTGTFPACLPSTVKAWTVFDWSSNTDLTEFNKQSTVSSSVAVPFNTLLATREDFEYSEDFKRSADVPTNFDNLNVWMFCCYNTKSVNKVPSISSHVINAMKDKNINILNEDGAELTKTGTVKYYKFKNCKPEDSATQKIDIIMINRQAFKQFADKKFPNSEHPMTDLFRSMKEKLKYRFILVSDYFAEVMCQEHYASPRSRTLLFKFSGADADSKQWSIQGEHDIDKFLLERQQSRIPAASKALDKGAAGGAAADIVTADGSAGGDAAMRAASSSSESGSVVSADDVDYVNYDFNYLKRKKIYIFGSRHPQEGEKMLVKMLKKYANALGYSVVGGPQEASYTVVVGNVENYRECRFVHYMCIMNMYFIVLALHQSSSAKNKFQLNDDKTPNPLDQYVFRRAGEAIFKNSDTIVTNDDDLNNVTFDISDVERAQEYLQSSTDDGLELDTKDTKPEDDDDVIIIEDGGGPSKGSGSEAPKLDSKSYYFHGNMAGEKLDELKGVVTGLGGTVSSSQLTMEAALIDTVKPNLKDLTQFNVLVDFKDSAKPDLPYFVHYRFLEHINVLVQAQKADPAFQCTIDLGQYLFKKNDRGYSSMPGRALPKKISYTSDFTSFMSIDPEEVKDAKTTLARIHRTTQRKRGMQSEIRRSHYVWAIQDTASSAYESRRDLLARYLEARGCYMVRGRDITDNRDKYPVIFYDFPIPGEWERSGATLIHSQWIYDLSQSITRAHLLKENQLDEDIYSFQFTNKYDWYISNDPNQLTEKTTKEPFWRNVFNKNIYLADNDAALAFFRSPYPHEARKFFGAEKRRNQQNPQTIMSRNKTGGMNMDEFDMP